MRNNLFVAAVAAAMFTGTAASAADHEVRLERYGYFPQKIYVQAGDTITFVNMSPNWARVYSNDYNDNQEYYNYNSPCAGYGSYDKKFNGNRDGFYTGWISRGSSVTITVTECMETVLYPPYIYQYSFDSNKYRGQIVFGTAPNS